VYFISFLMASCKTVSPVTLSGAGTLKEITAIASTL
jgi:hypothetical protein